MSYSPTAIFYTVEYQQATSVWLPEGEMAYTMRLMPWLKRMIPLIGGALLIKDAFEALRDAVNWVIRQYELLMERIAMRKMNFWLTMYGIGERVGLHSCGLLANNGEDSEEIIDCIAQKFDDLFAEYYERYRECEDGDHPGRQGDEDYGADKPNRKLSSRFRFDVDDTNIFRWVCIQSVQVEQIDTAKMLENYLDGANHPTDLDGYVWTVVIDEDVVLEPRWDATQWLQ